MEPQKYPPKHPKRSKPSHSQKQSNANDSSSRSFYSQNSKSSQQTETKQRTSAAWKKIKNDLIQKEIQEQAQKDAKNQTLKIKELNSTGLPLYVLTLKDTYKANQLDFQARTQQNFYSTQNEPESGSKAQDSISLDRLRQTVPDLDFRPQNGPKVAFQDPMMAPKFSNTGGYPSADQGKSSLNQGKSSLNKDLVEEASEEENRKLQEELQLEIYKNKAQKKLIEFENQVREERQQMLQKGTQSLSQNSKNHKPYENLLELQQNPFFGTVVGALTQNNRLDLYNGGPTSATEPPKKKLITLKTAEKVKTEPSIIDIFLQKNSGKMPVLQIKDFEELDPPKRTKVQPPKKPPLGKTENYNKNQALTHKLSTISIEEEYGDTFEKESGSQSQLKVTNTVPLNKNKILTKKNSKGSLISSEIAEEDYLKEAFDSGSIKESYPQQQSNQSRISESIKMDESVYHNNDIDSDIKEEYSSHSAKEANHKKKDDTEDDYQEEKFDSISESIEKTNNQQSKSDQESSSLKKSGLKEKKKSVTFESLMPSKEMPNPKKNSNGGAPLGQQTSFSQPQHHSHHKTSSPLSKASSGSGSYGDSPLNNKQMYDNELKLFPHDPKNYQEQNSRLPPKYSKLKFNDEEQELTRERLQMKKIETNIQSLLAKGHQMNEKWKKEALESNGFKLQGDYLYTKFQVEMNKLLNSTQMGNKLGLLSNYLLLNPQQQRLNSQQSTKSMDPKLLNPAHSSALDVLEKRQEVVFNVLNQVLENIAEIRKCSCDFDEMKEVRKKYDLKLDEVLKNQQKILTMQFEKQLKERDEKMFSMLQQILDKQGQVTYTIAQGPPENEPKKTKLQEILEKNANSKPTLEIQKENESSLDQYAEDFASFTASKSSNKKNQDFSESSIKKSLDSPSKRAEENSFLDKEAMTESIISWQSIVFLENLTENERKNQFNKDTNQIVDFLTAMLMEELKEDLFPVRQENMSNSQISVKKEISQLNNERVNPQFPKEKLQKQKKENSQKNQAKQEKKETNSQEIPIKEQPPLLSKMKPSKEEENESSDMGVGAFSRAELAKQLEECDSNNDDDKQFEQLRNKKAQPVLKEQAPPAIQDDELKEEEKKVYHNKAYQEKTESEVVKLKSMLLKKNKINLMKKFLAIVNRNNSDTFPKETSAALESFPFFEPIELPADLKENIVYKAFNEKLIAATIERINILKKQTPMKDVSLLEQLTKSFPVIVKTAEAHVIQQVKQVVPLNYYENVQSKASSIIDLQQNIQKEIKIFPLDDDDNYEAFEYDVFEAEVTFKNKIYKKILNDIVLNTVKEFDEIALKKKSMA